MAYVDKLINYVIQQTTLLVSWINLFVTKYSLYLVYALLLWIASKMLKINLKVDTSKGR